MFFLALFSVFGISAFVVFLGTAAVEGFVSLFASR